MVKGKTHAQAVATADELGVPLGEFCDAAVAYFAQRGLDPRSDHAREGAQIIGEVRKLGDRLFRFLQVQEQGLLLPLVQQVVQASLRADSARRQAGRALLSQEKMLGQFEEWEQSQQDMLLELEDKIMQKLVDDWAKSKGSRGGIASETKS